MNNASSMGTDEYGRLIKEAFIEPIRAVVVVDDEYPTLDGLIDKELGKNEKTWKSQNTKRARDIIAFCRSEERRWMLEIHDGQPAAGVTTDEGAAHHLNQTDLMVLDFHLDEHDQTDGSQAIDILRQLAANDHFNLVVVHTKGYEGIGGAIERVVREIAVGLTKYDEGLALEGGGLDAALGAIGEWENLEPDILSKLQEQLDEGAYLKARSSEECDVDSCKQFNEFGGLFGLLEQAPAEISRRVGLLLKWSISDLQEQLKDKLSAVDLGKVECKWFEDGVNWIRTNRLFVTVVSKEHAPETLPDKLLDALIRWSPTPHRLLMSKMRSELDERGVLAEGRVLSDTYLQAGWFAEYLTPGSAERALKIRNTVSRHWESLGDALQHNVLDFASRLGSHFESIGREEAINKYLPFKPDVAPHNENIATSLNKYACSKEVEGAYLSTGHVLEIVTGESTNYWLCLSPACDLVPGQKTTGWPGRLGSFTPFRAVMLFDEDIQTALKSADAGNHLFLNIGGSIQAFQFTPPIDEAADILNREPNPKWEEMFVAEQGRFSGDKYELGLVRIASEDDQLVPKSASAKVVAQLRYEYALNLLHRLGANLSRVGLDFAPFNRPAGKDGG
ncbi:response regulator receiver domain [Sulfuriflexus mobilis]|uniref:response regulator receiver domain n=1 Tax=Sulfuriflexus mobilis TaxID=1811807 RepID=UPI000F819822|nr:response regulator receiver domain [Sulfuriflexus mobilis]